MANKVLNDSLDMHLSKVKTGSTYRPKKKKPSLLKQILLCIKSIKEYFVPSPEYEHMSFSDHGVMVVKNIDKGFKKHLRIVRRVFKKRQKKVEKPEAPDIDASEVERVILQGKL